VNFYRNFGSRFRPYTSEIFRIDVSPICNFYEAMGRWKCEWRRRVGQEDTCKLGKDKVLFASHKIIMLQCVCQECQKCPPSSWTQSLARFSAQRNPDSLFLKEVSVNVSVSTCIHPSRCPLMFIGKRKFLNPVQF